MPKDREHRHAPSMKNMGVTDIFSSLRTPGVVTGAGRQKLGAYTNLGCFWGVGIPATVLLAFTFNLGVGFHLPPAPAPAPAPSVAGGVCAWCSLSAPPLYLLCTCQRI